MSSVGGLMDGWVVDGGWMDGWVVDGWMDKTDDRQMTDI